VKNLVKCGQMEGYTVDAPGTNISPTIETVPVDYGRLVYKACLAIVAPRAAAYSYRMRAIGETFGNQRDFLMRLEGELFELENGGDGGAMFNSFVDFQTWAMSVTGVNPWLQMTEMQINSPVATVTVGRDGIQVGNV
jgi:hypothetical protein